MVIHLDFLKDDIHFIACYFIGDPNVARALQENDNSIQIDSSELNTALVHTKEPSWAKN